MLEEILLELFFVFNKRLGLGKVEKPTKAKCEPRTTKITAKDDLRSGKKK